MALDSCEMGQLLIQRNPCRQPPENQGRLKTPSPRGHPYSQQKSADGCRQGQETPSGDQFAPFPFMPSGGSHDANCLKMERAVRKKLRIVEPPVEPLSHSDHLPFIGVW